MIDIISDPIHLRERLRSLRQRSIGLVPTMGALHAGHAALFQEARQQNDIVVASIFVNPLQFDRQEDLDKYPRTMDADARLCEDYGVDLIFAPGPADLYPSEQLTFVDSPALSAHLCGLHRPGHFRGVLTVVLKLFNIVQPDRAYFGEKDAQQLALIRRMTQDLNVPVTILPVPTVREADGLAMSSRNKHLTAEQRSIAPVLSQTLEYAVDLIHRGETSVEAIKNRASERFASVPEARVEYFELVNPETLESIQTITGPVLIAGAMWLGTTRLIDNKSTA